MKITIECDRNIKSLNIEFDDDGTFEVTETPTRPSKSQKPKRTEPKLQSSSFELIDIEADFGDVSQEVVEKPVIDLGKREPKVSGEMQNLEI